MLSFSRAIDTLQPQITVPSKTTVIRENYGIHQPLTITGVFSRLRQAVGSYLFP
jgi:hypothetical protein